MLGHNPYLKYFSKEGFQSYISFLDDAIHARVSAFENSPKGIIFQVGDNPASNIYVRNKIRLCQKFGIQISYVKSIFSSEDSLKRMIYCFRHENIPMMIQCPLPWEGVSVNSFNLGKLDIDGLHKESVVNPCTPSGILNHLSFVYGSENVNIEGKTILIINRSELVGKPLARMATEYGMNVIQIHSKTSKRDREIFYGMADVIVCAVGKRDFITLGDVDDFMRPDVMIYDVGINHTEEGKLIGDCDSRLFEHGYAVSPVPGGVGLLTTRMFVQNLLTISNLVNTN